MVSLSSLCECFAVSQTIELRGVEADLLATRCGSLQQSDAVKMSLLVVELGMWQVSSRCDGIQLLHTDLG